MLFDYRDGRSREGPTQLLKNFKGYLQSDGYIVYDSFEKKQGITLLNCMAHACRGFEKALDYDKKKAEHAMDLFQKIYAVERKAREGNMSLDERFILRLDESLPELNKLGKWMAETYNPRILNCNLVVEMILLVYLLVGIPLYGRELTILNLSKRFSLLFLLILNI